MFVEFQKPDHKVHIDVNKITAFSPTTLEGKFTDILLISGHKMVVSHRPVEVEKILREAGCSFQS